MPQPSFEVTRPCGRRPAGPIDESSNRNLSPGVLLAPRDMTQFGFTVPSTLPGLLVLAVGLAVLWVAVSIPVYISGKLITGGRAELGSAMGSTLGGTLVYFIVLYGAGIFLQAAFGPTGLLASFALAIVAWLAVYRSSFDTSWVGAVGIVVVGWLVLVAMDAVLASLFGVSLPSFNPF